MRKPKKRQCSVCGEVKPLSEFYTYKYKGEIHPAGSASSVTSGGRGSVTGRSIPED